MISGTTGPTVYFDQSVWSLWLREQYSAATTAKLMDLAGKKRFLFILSKWHVMETVKFLGTDLRPEEARSKLKQAQFMDRLPNLLGLRDTQDLLVQELARAYATHVGGSLKSDPPPVFRIEGFLQQVQEGLACEAGYVPRTLQEANAQEGGRGSLGAWSWLDSLMHRPNLASHRAACLDRSQAGGPRTLLKAVRELLTIRSIQRASAAFIAMLEPRALTLPLLAFRQATAEFLGMAPLKIDFFRWLWGQDFRGSPALIYWIEYSRRLNPRGQRKPDANDGLDREHGFSAPFVDFLVHEASHAEIARQAAKKAGLKCKILSGRPKARGLEELVDLLDEPSE